MKRHTICLIIFSWLLFVVGTPALFAEVASGPDFKDKVILIDNQAIEGTVLAITDKGYHLKLEYGQVILLKERVRRIIFDYEKRSALLKGDDQEGHLNLGKMCLGQEMFEAASKEFRAITSLPNPPEDLGLMLAKALYGKGSYTEARKALEAYLAKKPGDADALGLMVKILKAEKDHPAKSEEIKTEPDAAKSETPAQPTKRYPDQLEAERGWAVETADWANSGSAEVVKVPEPSTKEDNLILSVKFTAKNNAGQPRDKTAVNLTKNLDLSGHESLSLTAFVPKDSPPIKLAVAFNTGNFVWFETPVVTLKSGEWTTEPIKFSLTSDSFKSQATGWAYKTKLLDLDKTKQMILLIYTVGNGQVFFDDIKFVPKTESKTTDKPEPKP